MAELFSSFPVIEWEEKHAYQGWTSWRVGAWRFAKYPAIIAQCSSNRTRRCASGESCPPLWENARMARPKGPQWRAGALRSSAGCTNPRDSTASGSTISIASVFVWGMARNRRGIVDYPLWRTLCQKLLAPIHPGEILREDVLKPLI